MGLGCQLLFVLVCQQAVRMYKLGQHIKCLSANKDEGLSANENRGLSASCQYVYVGLAQQIIVIKYILGFDSMYKRRFVSMHKLGFVSMYKWGIFSMYKCGFAQPASSYNWRVFCHVMNTCCSCYVSLTGRAFCGQVSCQPFLLSVELLDTFPLFARPSLPAPHVVLLEPEGHHSPSSLEPDSLPPSAQHKTPANSLYDNTPSDLISDWPKKQFVVGTRDGNGRLTVG